MASRIDDQLLKLRLRLLQEKLSAIEQQDSARSRSRPSSKGSGSSATRLLLENAQRRRSELERRLQEERLARERALARPSAPQYVPLMLPPVESKRSPDYMELMMMQNSQLNQLITSQLMLSLMRPQQPPPPRTPSPRRSPYERPVHSMPLVPPLRGLEDASTSRLMTYFEKEYRAAGALSDRHAHLRPMAGAAAAHPLATGRRRKFNRLSMRVDAGENKRFSDHIEHID